MAKVASSSALSFGFCFVFFTASGCGTDAVGVEECRDIETARCEAGASCGIVDDVEGCVRFYRDHCLHGLSAAAVPDSPSVQACVEAIQTAGVCAEDDPEIALDQCEGGAFTKPVPGEELNGACDVVLYPERSETCSFLVPRAESNEKPDAGGEGGAGSEDIPEGGSAGASG